MNDKEDIESFKVCIVGGYAVGKTSLINRYLTGLFTIDYFPTVASCFTKISVQDSNKRKVSVNLWDTAGQEKYQSITPLFLQDSDGVILVIDITAPESFDYVKKWVNNEWSCMSPLPKLIICLNKCDCKPTFDIENVARFALNFDIPVVQTSALYGSNVRELFQKVINILSASNHHKSYVCVSLNEDNDKPCC